MPCTDRVAPGEHARAGRWRGKTKTECGIHLPIGKWSMNGMDGIQADSERTKRPPVGHVLTDVRGGWSIIPTCGAMRATCFRHPVMFPINRVTTIQDDRSNGIVPIGPEVDFMAPHGRGPTSACQQASYYSTGDDGQSSAHRDPDQILAHLRRGELHALDLLAFERLADEEVVLGVGEFDLEDAGARLTCG